MSNDKSVHDHSLYDDLPEPIRSFAKCGKVFGVAVDKIPVLPAKWRDKTLLKKYSQAIGARDQMIKEGKNAVLYMVMTDTPYRLLDFDADKETGKLRESQTKVIEHYQSNGHSAMKSSSDVGRHMIVEDKDRQLPKIGNNLVEAGKIPFEVKHDLVFLTENIINERPPRTLDDTSIKKIKAVKEPETLPREASTTKPDKPSKVSKAKPNKVSTTKPKKPFNLAKAKQKEALAVLRDAIKYCKDNNITDVIRDDSTFSEFVMGAKQVKQPFDEQYNFCDSQGGDKTNIRQRIESTNEPKTDRRAALFKLFEDRGYVVPSKEPPKGTFEVDHELGRKRGFQYCLEKIGIKVRYNELVGIEIKLPDKDWQELNDDLFENVANDYVAVRAVKKSKNTWLPFEPSNETMRSVYTSMAFKGERYNPTREWLKQIPVKEDPEAIDIFISCYQMDCYGRLAEGGYTPEEIKEYTQAFVILMMSGWIRRSLTPGCISEIIAIIVGPRGCGKGLGLKLQLPPKGIDPISGEIIPNDAFGDRCQISDERQAWYKNRRCSLGEVTELVGFSKPGNEKLKASLSATHDKHELKYKNYATSEPRAYNWTGTSNNKHFKPADGEGDRRTAVNDLGYGFEGGKKVVSRELPKILNDEWRRRAVGHILWLIKVKGYTGQPKDWSDKVEEMREFMVGQSTKHYSRIEQALIAVAYGTTEHYKMVFKGPEVGSIAEPKPEWRHYNYHKLLNADGNNYNSILRNGLPFNPPNYPETMPTWIRLLTLHDKQMVDKYGADTIKLVATAHMKGWKWIEERERKGFNRCRGWLIPDPKHGNHLYG